MAAVWPDTKVEDANLAVQISALRRILDSFIQTVPGRGYRFVAAVTLHGEDASQPEDPTIDETPLTPDAVLESAVPGWKRHARAGLAIMLLIAAAVGGLAATWIGRHDEPARPRLSIVVLPFANLGDDPEQEYLADAITDDLTTDLSRISGSVVIAHSTALTYRARALDARLIGRELGVSYILEGSVRRMGDQVQVNAQLVDTERGAHVWAERFETDRRDLARAQGEITGRLARSLDLQLIEAVDSRIEWDRKTDPDAKELAMRGWVLWFRPFERALEIDPRSIDARIGAAIILISNVGLGLSRSPQQDGVRAEQLLLEAIKQDANSSRAHEVLGTLRRIENRLDQSRIEFETAVALDRNNAHALLGLGQTLMFLGRPAEGIVPIERSMRLNPLDPNIAFGHWSLGACHLLLGHTEKAADLLRRAHAENPRVYFFQIYLAGTLGLLGEIDEARAALEEAIRLRPVVNSLAQWNAAQPWIGNPALMALRQNTLDLGLRRAGMRE